MISERKYGYGKIKCMSLERLNRGGLCSQKASL